MQSLMTGQQYRNYILDLIKQYPANRQQRVKIGQSLSQMLDIY